MSRTLTLQVSDRAYSTLQREAEVNQTSPAALAAASLEICFGRKPDTRAAPERQSARLRFEHHFGEIDLGHPTGVDNERIDADLAREYADTHERP